MCSNTLDEFGSFAATCMKKLAGRPVYALFQRRPEPTVINSSTIRPIELGSGMAVTWLAAEVRRPMKGVMSRLLTEASLLTLPCSRRPSGRVSSRNTA